MILEIVGSQKVASKHYHLGNVQMSKKSRAYTMSDDVHSLMQILQPPKVESNMSTQFFMLTNTNYSLWGMRMEVTLKAHDL